MSDEPKPLTGQGVSSTKQLSPVPSGGKLWAAVVARDGARCGICKAEDLLLLDHDHACCERGCYRCVRGILCHNCNTGLGLFVDNPGRLRSAAEYIERDRASFGERIRRTKRAVQKAVGKLKRRQRDGKV